MRKGHRLIILPPYQGLGLGVLLSSWVGQYYLDQGMRFRSSTTHPSLVHQRSKSPLWEFVYKKENKMDYDPTTIKGRMSAGHRTTYTYEFVGTK